MKMTLNTLFDFNTKGIFGYLDEYDVPWKNVVPSNLLDLDYHTTHGDKVISKTVSALLEPNGLSDDNKQKLAHLIYAKNSVKWTKLWETIGLYDKFNVLDNTSWEETVTHEHEGLDIRDLAYGKQKQTFNKGEQNNEVNQGQQSLTQGAQTNKTGAQKNSVENKTSAFNSNSYQPDNSQSQSLGQREDSVGQRIDTVGAKIDTSKDGARQDVRENDAYADKDTLDTFFKDTVSTTRHGNIGVTTSGQLIDDFRKIVDWTIFDTVFEDVNAILVLDFFGDCDADLDDYTIETNYVLPSATVNRLGGIKVGRNLSVEADGTLNAQADAGDVNSVNGKTGVVVLTNEDVNAPSIAAFNNLAASKQDKIVTEGFENGTFYGIWNGVASFREVMQVPGYDGQKGQVLTKSDGVRYEWKDSVGGGSQGVAVFETNHVGKSGYKVKYNTYVAIPFEKVNEELTYNNDFCEVVELTKVSEPYLGQKSYALKILKDGCYNLTVNGYLNGTYSDRCYTAFRKLNDDTSLEGKDLGVRAIYRDVSAELYNSTNAYLKINDLVIFRYYSNYAADERTIRSLYLSVAKLC